MIANDCKCPTYILPTILTDVNSTSSISSGGGGGSVSGGCSMQQTSVQPPRPQTNGCPSPPSCGVTSNVPLLGDSQPQTRSTSVKDLPTTITTASTASPIPKHHP